VEEHFYLLWPMLLLVVKPKRAGRVAFMLAVLVFAWREILFKIDPSSNYFTRTDCRIDGLLWGCLAAIYFPALKKFCSRLRFSQLWIPLVAILLIAEALHVHGLNSLYIVLLPALVLSTVLQPDSVLGRILEWRPLRWIGTISYSLYLWQMLFLPMRSMEARGPFARLQLWPWNVLAILLCAVASRYLLEIPMTQLGHRLSKSPFILHTPPIPIGGGSTPKAA
jgi:peptidoglycan/LPS O-acetylase OafA/YrhL